MRYYLQISTFTPIMEIEAHNVPPVSKTRQASRHRIFNNRNQNMTTIINRYLPGIHRPKSNNNNNQKPHGSSLHHFITAEDKHVRVRTRSKWPKGASKIKMAPTRRIDESPTEDLYCTKSSSSSSSGISTKYLPEDGSW